MWRTGMWDPEPEVRTREKMQSVFSETTIIGGSFISALNIWTDEAVLTL